MRSFLTFLKESEECWYHVHDGATFTLKAKVPTVSKDSTIPQAQGKVGVFVTQQPWLWTNYYDTPRTHCTEIRIPAEFTPTKDYLEGMGERFITNLNGVAVGDTVTVDSVQNHGN